MCYVHFTQELGQPLGICKSILGLRLMIEIEEGDLMHDLRWDLLSHVIDQTIITSSRDEAG